MSFSRLLIMEIQRDDLGGSGLTGSLDQVLAGRRLRELAEQRLRLPVAAASS